MKIGAVGDKEGKIAGDLDCVPFEERTMATDAPLMKGSMGQMISGLELISLLLLKLKLHSKEAASLKTVTASKTMEPALLGMHLHDSQMALNTWSYNFASE
jgi:hypothetical protein